MLPIIFGHEKVNAKVINAIWLVLDFVYMAQYPLLSDLNLSKMKDLLSLFNQSKEVFISNGSQELHHFCMPKLHALQHCIHDVHSGGTPENCSTKTPKCHAPSWLDPGEPSHTRIHLTMDRDSTQLNTSPCVGNTEYSPTRTSPGRQGQRVDSTHTIFIHLAYNTL